MLKRGSVIQPTMFLASLDIRAAFDEAIPRHIAKMMESRNKHGWLIAALLREMSGLEGEVMFECREFFYFQSMAAKIVASVEGKCRKTWVCCWTSNKGEKAHQKSHSKRNVERSKDEPWRIK